MSREVHARHRIATHRNTANGDANTEEGVGDGINGGLNGRVLHTTVEECCVRNTGAVMVAQCKHVVFERNKVRVLKWRWEGRRKRKLETHMALKPKITMS